MQKNAVVNAIALTGTLVVNGLANALPINGKTTGELSDLYPNLFVPAGFTFSIWAVIYVLLIGFVINGFFKSKNPNSEVYARIGWLFVANCVLNIAWIVAWHYLQVELSVIIMLGILGTLIAIYTRLGIGKNSEATLREKWLVLTPFSVYLGWISVATIANITALLVYKGWFGGSMGELLWAQIMIVVAAILAVTMVLRRHAIAYALVVIWALFGIWYKHKHLDSMEDTDVELAAIVSITIITLAIFWRAFNRIKYPRA